MMRSTVTLWWNHFRDDFNDVALLYSVNPITSEVVEARRDQTHLGTYFSTRPQARRIQALLNNFLMGHILHLNFTDCFGDNRVLLKIPMEVYKPSPNLSLSSLIRYLTLRRISPSSIKELRHFLIYHYITAITSGLSSSYHKGQLKGQLRHQQ